MNDTADRRVQLRDSIHKMVIYWSERRGISPAAFVSVAIYEYLRSCGELTDIPVTGVTPPPAPKKPDLPPKVLTKEDRASVVAAWSEDDDDEDDIPSYTPSPATETSRERLARLKREAEESGEYDD